MIPQWLAALTGANAFAKGTPGGGPSIGDAFQGIGHSMMEHYRGTPGSLQSTPAAPAPALPKPPVPMQVMPGGNAGAIPGAPIATPTLANVLPALGWQPPRGAWGLPPR